MQDFVSEPDPCVLSLLKQHYTLTNGKNGGDGDYDTFSLHSKASTLRSIRNRTANCSVSDGILESLILVDEIDRRRGVPPSDAMREAFCAVAVHLTLRWLPVSWDAYWDAVRRVWGRQIGNLELLGASGLLSSGLAKWRKEFEAALWDRETAERLLVINTLEEALRLIRVYLKEAFCRLPGHLTADDVTSAPTEENETFGANSHTQNKPHSSRRQHKGVVIGSLAENRPSCTKNGSQSASEFNGLQQVPLKAITGELGDEVTDLLSETLNAAEMVASGTKTKISQVEGIAKDSNKDIGDPTNCCTDKGKRISMVNSQTRCDTTSSHRHHEQPAVVAAREEDCPSYRKYVSLSSSETDKVRDTLKSSVVDFEVGEKLESYVAAAKKSHTEGSEGDGNIKLGAPDETIRKDHDRMDGNVPAPSADHTAEPSQDKGNGAFIRPNKVRRTGIMERNDTACTFEWEYSIDDSSKESDSFSNRRTLPTPRKKHVSPLNIDEPKRWGRRKVNRWTDEEEKALAEGVRKYGNQWTRILESNKGIFRDRSSVDLKDKWRNLLRK